MASKFWLACAAWLCCDFSGYKYHGQEYNGGIGIAAFATICTMTADWNITDELPRSDTGYKMIALSMVIWPGVIWGLASYALLSAAEDQVACVWLITTPLFVVLLGLSVLADRRILDRRLENWRITTGLSWLGILTGHALGKSSLGRSVEHYTSGLLAAVVTSTALVTIVGAAMMFLSVARLAQSHSRAIQVLQMNKGIPTDTIIPFGFPPLWGAQGPWFAITWTIGLASCIGAVDQPRAQALLGSTSVAIVLSMAFFPPFSGKLLGLRYDEYMRLLSILHISMVSSLCLYSSLIAPQSRIP